MDFLPIYVALRDRRVVVSGGGAMAVAKIKLLLKTKARIAVFACEPDNTLLDWQEQGRLTLHHRQVSASDLEGVSLVYSAHGLPEENARVAALASEADILINVADDIDRSDFITPAVVDRSPVVVAIGTEGTAPVLARAIKSKIEAMLPQITAEVAEQARALRPRVKGLLEFAERRRFWRNFLRLSGVSEDRDDFSDLQVPGEAEINELLEDHQAQDRQSGRVVFVGAGPGDPDLMTLKARKALDQADVVIHDRLVSPEILDLARREAALVDVGKKGHGPSTSQAKINALIKASALAGEVVVRLKGGDPSVFGRLDEEIDVCLANDIPWSVIPGITAASAAAASIGCSLSQRGRNTEIALVTGHAMGGFVDQDWQRLAKANQVAAIYMGRRAARYLQGRLLMHGADPDTPVSCISSASMTHQMVFETRLGELAEALDADKGTDPLMLLYGVRPARTVNASEADLSAEVQHGTS